MPAKWPAPRRRPGCTCLPAGRAFARRGQFGERGRVLPGSLFGAVLTQTIENGLVLRRANLYAYPVVAGTLIFSPVLIDHCRQSRADKCRES